MASERKRDFQFDYTNHSHLPASVTTSQIPDNKMKTSPENADKLKVSRYLYFKLV